MHKSCRVSSNLSRQSRMNNLRTKIRKRSKYAFSSGLNGGRRREPASERVDWEFVGFPSTSSRNNNQQQQVSPNSSNLFLDSSTSSGFSLHNSNSHNSNSHQKQQQQQQLQQQHQRPPEPPITFNWDEPLHPRNSWSFSAGIPIEDTSPPPPVPPRNKTTSRPSPAPPPRPASLYSKLTVPPPIPSSSSSSSGDKLYIPSSRKRPRSAGGRSAGSADGEFPPVIPPHRSVPPVPSPDPVSVPSDVPPPPVPRHMHASGIPMSLPLSPPAPPPPPHASPIRSDPLSPLYAKPSHFNRDVAASLASLHSIDSQFYRRPASLRLDSSERHRHKQIYKPVKVTNMDGNCSSNYCSIMREHPYDDVLSIPGKKSAI